MPTKSGSSGFSILKYAICLYSYATVFNYPWELAQGAFFLGMGNIKIARIHCFGSALGDGVITLIVYLFGSAMNRSWVWSFQMNVRKYIEVAVIGLAVGAVIEWIALNVLHRWSYAPDMPTVPFLDLGLLPVLQMAFLLPIIFFFASKYRI